MQCPRCQQENPPQAKFCLECATPLALRCSNCGTQLPTGAKFCFECATPVSAANSPLRFVSPEIYTPKHLAEKILTSKAALEGDYGMKFNVSGSGPAIGISNRSVGMG
jgi:ribosomal protein L40E